MNLNINRLAYWLVPNLLLPASIANANSIVSTGWLIDGQFEYMYWPQSTSIDDSSDGKSSGYSMGFTYSPKSQFLPNWRAYTTTIQSDTVDYAKNDVSGLYYLKNDDWTQLGVGAGLTQLSGNTNFASTRRDLDRLEPHIYGVAAIGSRQTIVRLYGEFTIASGLYDTLVGVKYPIDFGAFGAELESGYRVLSVDYMEYGGLNLPFKSETKGYFAGINFVFF